jgi:RNA polymerase sigma factor (sigma-70 family)
MKPVKRSKVWLYHIIPDALIRDALDFTIEATNREKAARELYEKVYKNCWNFLSRLEGCSIEDAEDLAQEVLYSIYKAGILSGSYATKINRNKIADFRKQYNRQRRLMSGIPIYSEHDESSDEDVRIASENEISLAVQLDQMIQRELQERQEELTRKIEEIGNSLPEGAIKMGWQALCYQVYEGLSYSEIAEKMGANENTVKSWVKRCKEYITKQVMTDSYPIFQLKEISMFVGA